MAKKYIAVRVSLEAYKSFKIKQKNMNEMYRKITGKKKAIPLTKVINVSSKEPIFINDRELIKIFKNGGRKIC
jgi:hypothetical protein